VSWHENRRGDQDCCCTGARRGPDTQSPSKACSLDLAFILILALQGPLRGRQRRTSDCTRGVHFVAQVTPCGPAYTAEKTLRSGSPAPNCCWRDRWLYAATKGCTRAASSTRPLSRGGSAIPRRCAAVRALVRAGPKELLSAQPYWLPHAPQKGSGAGGSGGAVGKPASNDRRIGSAMAGPGLPSAAAGLPWHS
jgi:hypothetical protein